MTATAVSAQEQVRLNGYRDKFALRSESEMIQRAIIRGSVQVYRDHRSRSRPLRHATLGKSRLLNRPRLTGPLAAFLVPARYRKRHRLRCSPNPAPKVSNK